AVSCSTTSARRRRGEALQTRTSDLNSHCSLPIPRPLTYPLRMSNARKQLDFLNGVPEMLLLRLLSRRKMHGYQIVRAIADASGGALAFGEGCVYPILHRLAD